MRKYYSLVENENEASINIYGDIVSWEWVESDVSSYTLSKELEGLSVDKINVYINSYGGEVAEGIAIYNTLKRHKSKVVTHCDGMACSIASVIFMAGDERVMEDASLLMIHNAWTNCSGNANDMKKAAEDLETINNLSVKAYMSKVNISQEELRGIMDNETFLSAEDALAKGFATGINKEKSENYSQSAKRQVVNTLLGERSIYADATKMAEVIVESVKEQLKIAPIDIQVSGRVMSEVLKKIKSSKEDAEEEPEDTEEEEETLSDETDDDPEPDEEPDEDKDETENQKNESVQMWTGFFNAIGGKKV